MASSPPPGRRVGTSSSLSSRLNVRHPRSRSHSPSAQTSMAIPDRFKVDEEEDGADTAGDPSADAPMQSFYGLLALGQAKGGLPSKLPRTAEESDDEEEDAVARSIAASSETTKPNKPASRYSPARKAAESSSRSTLDAPTEDNADHDPMTQSQFLLPRSTRDQASDQPRAPTLPSSSSPTISRKLQAQATAELEASRETPSRRSQESERERSIRERADLPTTLKNMFQFDNAEDLIHEFKCFYVQNVLLQGHFFITQHHICFYAYLPKKGSVPIKTGHLAKQGKRDPRYSRYWFILKGDVLSYYTSAANPHFPAGTVDLRNAISAEVVAERGKAKNESTTFTITMENRIYHMKADSVTSANEWIKQLQRVIFRSHNDGNAVKISVPIANLMDVEKSPITDFTDTVRLRAVDNDKSFSVEEYFFTFLDRGEQAFRILRAFASENQASKRVRAAIAREDALNHSPRPRSRSPYRPTSYFDLPRSPEFSPEPLEPVRSTLSPLGASKASPRTSGEFGRSSGELSRASSQKTRQKGDRAPPSPGSPTHGSVDASSESFAPSSGRSNSPVAALDNMTSSQFLTGDSAFQAPTMHRGPPRTASKYVEPPTRTSSQQTVSALQRKSVPESSAEVKGSRGISTPLFDLAGRFRDQGKRMGSYLSSSPKDYYSRFSGALAGGKRHYAEAEGLMADDRAYDEGEDAEDNEEHRRRFLDHFALPDTENLEAVFYCSLLRVLPLYGKIYVGSRHLCFRSLLYGTKTKVNLPFADIETVRKARSFRWSYPGMIIVIRGHEEIFFDFSSAGDRDDCVVTLLKILEGLGNTAESTLLTEEEYHAAEMAAAEHELLQEARGGINVEKSAELQSYIDPNKPDTPAILFDDASASILDFKPQEPLRIVCLTIGSRGDVQPYVALCKGLLKEGHRPCIATHAEFEHFATKHGIDFVPVAGDPAELMRICVEYGMFTPSFVWQANAKFRGWLDGLLNSAYDACKDADLLIESPSAMAGIHIAEALKIPYFRAFTMPWTRTRAYPHAFAVPNKKLGGGYNMMSYVMFDHMFWTLTASQMNKWRANVLGLKPTTLEKLQPNKVPFLYNFSPSVVTPPLDFSDWVRVTGYWFLDEADSWTPPPDLLAFIEKAREDKQKLVYIGFGSVVVNDARRLTEQIIQAVAKADVRCILSKGWSDRLNVQDAKLPEVTLPDSIFRITAAPHDWLFRQVDAVVHHGGAGTTGASLRAGVPTIIKPFFGDQFFFATRVEDLGVGVFLKSISVNGLGKALWIATHDDRMRTKARILGERIRAENGVDTAIKAIYRDMEYAKTLIKQRQLRAGKSKLNTDGSTVAPDELDEDDDEEEESWTFVEQESETEMSSRRDSQSAGVQSQGLGRMGVLGLRRGRYGLG